MLHWLLLISFVSSSSSECLDLVPFCEHLKPVCIGSIIVDQLQQLQTVADQISNSTSIPALEQSLPQEASSDSSDENILSLENSLPLIKESLPLIRESLPLLRESLPLLRQFLDPNYFSGDASACQKKVTCKSCRECPQLRDAVTSLVEGICPATCRRCPNGVSGEEAAEDLVKFYM